MTDNDDPPPSTESAEIAAEAIRTLNYSSRSDLRYPSDVYTVLGSLSVFHGQRGQLRKHTPARHTRCRSRHRISWRSRRSLPTLSRSP